MAKLRNQLRLALRVEEIYSDVAVQLCEVERPKHNGIQ